MGSAPPRRQIQDEPTNNGIDPKVAATKRFKAVVDCIGYLEMPVITIAAIQEQRNPGQISPYALDLFVIEANKPAIAAHVVEFANEYPVLGAVLDKFATGGPLVGLFMLSLTIGSQCLENHGKLPEKARGAIPGLIPREELANVVQAKMEEREAAMADIV